MELPYYLSERHHKYFLDKGQLRWKQLTLTITLCQQRTAILILRSFLRTTIKSERKTLCGTFQVVLANQDFPGRIGNPGLDCTTNKRFQVPSRQFLFSEQSSLSEGTEENHSHQNWPQDRLPPSKGFECKYLRKGCNYSVTSQLFLPKTNARWKMWFLP